MDFAGLLARHGWSIAALTISTIALILGVLNYRRKAGVHVRGNYQLCSSSMDCNDPYISSVVLENLKDRAVTIFAIYVRFGHNYYVTLAEFGDKPLLLKAYESYSAEYGPIEFYAVNTKRIKMDALMSGKRTKPGRIVLSTADGKYVVPRSIREWNPITEHFANHLTGVIRPIRSFHDGKPFGANIAYVVTFSYQDGSDQHSFIHPEDYRFKKFRNFQLTEESLISADSLREFLDHQRKSGAIICKDLAVFDVSAWRSETNMFYSGEPVEATRDSAFTYFVLGRIATIISDWRLSRSNRRMQLDSQAEQKRVAVNQDDSAG